MARKRAENVPASDPAPADESLRIDLAHISTATADAPQGDPPVSCEPAQLDNTPAATAELVRTQAAQLAAHLHRQQQDLDHRESELNARLAAMENQIRAARLWIDEREAELSMREMAVVRSERRTAPTSDEPINVRRNVADHVDDEVLRQRAEELDRRAAELEAAGRKLAERFGYGEGKSGLEALEAYRAQLEHSEKLLATAQAQWQEKFRELAEQRASFSRHMETERHKLADERRRWLETHRQDERERKRQQTELANRAGALEALRADVLRAQQETLEMRLAIEELWSQLSERMPPAALAQSLGKVRLRLTEEFRLAKAELTAEKAKIKQLAEQVADQHHALAEKRQQLQGWLSGRLRDFEQLSAQLAERERQLDERRLAVESERSQWQAERFRLEQELRKLLRHGGQPRSASAA